MVGSIDEVLTRVVESGELAGVVATAGSRDGITYEGAFGVRDIDSAVPMTTDTVVWIASMTKAITGAAAMQLVEQGRLSLDDPAGAVLPALGAVQVLDGFDGEGQPKLRPPASPVTLRHLLTHTSGYGYDIWSPELVQYQEATGTPGVTGCENAALTTPLLFDPGTAWMYGIGIDWAGKLIEETTGQMLGDYLDEHILGPLAMVDTGFRISDDMRTRLSSVHGRGEDGALSLFPFELPQEPEFQMGGGGLYGTVGDYLRFTRSILNGGVLDGNRILAADTVETMSQNHIGAVDVVTLETAIPPFSNNANLFPGMQQKWGLTFLINTEETEQGRSAGSLAWAGLANSYYWIDPVNDVTGVWATQVVPFADDISLTNFGDFEQAVYTQ